MLRQQQPAAQVKDVQRAKLRVIARPTLLPRLAVTTTQRRRVGKVVVGRVDQPHAGRGRRVGGDHAQRELPEQPVIDPPQQLQRQPLPRLRQRRNAHSIPVQRPRLGQRRVAAQQLQHQQHHRLRRAELALPPAVADLPGGGEDRPLGKQLIQVGVDVTQRGGDSRSHPWPPVRGGVLNNTSLSGGRVSRQSRKARCGADLRTK